MLKKSSIIFFSIAIICISGVKAHSAYPSSYAVGLALSGGYPNGVGAVLTFKIPPVPIMFGLNMQARFGKINYFNLTILADWWGLKLPISGPFNFYLGPGIDLGFDVQKNYFNFGLGIRMPAGVSVVMDFIEIYLEFAPGLHIIDAGTPDGFAFAPSFTIGVQFGVRLWMF